MTSSRKRGWHATLVALALVVAFSGGAVAKGRFDATFAKNADKVDGKHAVTSNTPPAKRKGKLVATSPQSGKLPGNIVGTVDRASSAADADRLGGVPAAALRTVTMPITSAGTYGGVITSVDEIALDSGSDATVSWTMVVPADHDPADDVFTDLVYAEGSAAACAWHVVVGGAIESGDGFDGTTWDVPGTNTYFGQIAIPAGPATAFHATFRLATQIDPGKLVTFTLTRQPTDPSDSCAAISLKGVQFRY